MQDLMSRMDQLTGFLQDSKSREKFFEGMLPDVRGILLL